MNNISTRQCRVEKGRFSKCVLITLLKLSWSFAVLDLLSAFFNRGGEERGSVYVGCFGPHMSHYVPHGGCMLQSWEQAGLLRTGQPVWPRKQDPKTLHSSEKSWGGRLVERQRPEGLPVQPPCRLVILEGEASIGVELLFWPCPSNNTISPQEDRLRLAVSRRSTSRGWPAMPPSGPTRASRCRATRATRAPGQPG